MFLARVEQRFLTIVYVPRRWSGRNISPASYMPGNLYSPERLRASSGFTLTAQRTAFTSSAIISPKVNHFRWNLEHCEPNVGHWTWGAIRAVATIWEGAEIFCHANNTRFRRFPSGKFYDISTQPRRSVSPCKLSQQQNFENFTIRGLFLKKRKICFKKF